MAVEFLIRKTIAINEGFFYVHHSVIEVTEFNVILICNCAAYLLMKSRACVIKPVNGKKNVSKIADTKLHIVSHERTCKTEVSKTFSISMFRC